MKKYTVSVYYEERGTIAIEATSKMEADMVVKKAMENEGMEGLVKLGFDVSDRDYDTTNVEEV